MQDLKISLAQYDIVWNDKQANFSKIENLLKSKKEDFDLLILPEMFNTGFSMNPETLAEKPDSISLDFLKRIAKENNTAVAGSFMVEEAGKYYNRLYFVEPNGDYKTYDKRHLFRMGNEHNHFSGGNSELIITYKSWKIKFLICYDLRFPVWSKNKYENQEFEYDILVYVANWPEVRVHVWEKLLQARAIENLSYSIGVNRIGLDGKNLNYNGRSLACDFKGDLIKNLKNSEEIYTFTVSKENLKEFRNKFNVGLDWDKFEIK